VHKFGKFQGMLPAVPIMVKVSSSGMLSAIGQGQFIRNALCNRKFLSRNTPIGLRTKEFEALVGSTKLVVGNFDNLFKLRNECRSCLPLGCLFVSERFAYGAEKPKYSKWDLKQSKNNPLCDTLEQRMLETA
jgi:hypothetical protein